MTTYRPPSPPMIPARHKGARQDPTLLVVHATVGPSKAGSARGVAHMWNGPASPISSAHYVTDEAETIQCVGDHTEAYHCGYNHDSIGLEMCFMPLASSLANWLLPKSKRTRKVKAHARITPLRWLQPVVRRMMTRNARLQAELHLAYDIPVRYLDVAGVLAWDRAGRPARLGGWTTHAVMSKAFKKSTHWDPGAWPRRLYARTVRRQVAALKAAAGTQPAPTPAPVPTPTPTGRLRVVHAPLHGVDATTAELQHALDLGKGGVVAFSEAYSPQLQAFLGKQTGWQRLRGSTSRVDDRKRHVGWDVTLMIDADRPILDHGSFKAADEVKASLRVAPERWVVWAVLGPKTAPTLVVGAHLHADPETGKARGREYAAELERIEALIVQQRTRFPNLAVVLPSDMNHRDDGKPLSPAPMFKRLAMRWHTNGLDWIAWAGLTKRRVRTILRKQDGQDHPWFVVDFDC